MNVVVFLSTILALAQQPSDSVSVHELNEVFNQYARVASQGMPGVFAVTNYEIQKSKDLLNQFQKRATLDQISLLFEAYRKHLIVRAAMGEDIGADPNVLKSIQFTIAWNQLPETAEILSAQGLRVEATDSGIIASLDPYELIELRLSALALKPNDANFDKALILLTRRKLVESIYETRQLQTNRWDERAPSQLSPELATVYDSRVRQAREIVLRTIFRHSLPAAALNTVVKSPLFSDTELLGILKSSVKEGKLDALSDASVKLIQASALRLFIAAGLSPETTAVTRELRNESVGLWQRSLLEWPVALASAPPAAQKANAFWFIQYVKSKALIKAIVSTLQADPALKEHKFSLTEIKKQVFEAQISWAEANKEAVTVALEEPTAKVVNADTAPTFKARRAEFMDGAVIQAWGAEFSTSALDGRANLFALSNVYSNRPPEKRPKAIKDLGTDTENFLKGLFSILEQNGDWGEIRTTFDGQYSAILAKYLGEAPDEQTDLAQMEARLPKELLPPKPGASFEERERYFLWKTLQDLKKSRRFYRLDREKEPKVSDLVPSEDLADYRLRLREAAIAQVRLLGFDVGGKELVEIIKNSTRGEYDKLIGLKDAEGGLHTDYQRLKQELAQAKPEDPNRETLIEALEAKLQAIGQNQDESISLVRRTSESLTKAVDVALVKLEANLFELLETYSTQPSKKELQALYFSDVVQRALANEDLRPLFKTLTDRRDAMAKISKLSIVWGTVLGWIFEVPIYTSFWPKLIYGGLLRPFGSKLLSRFASGVLGAFDHVVHTRITSIISGAVINLDLASFAYEQLIPESWMFLEVGPTSWYRHVRNLYWTTAQSEEGMLSPQAFQEKKTQFEEERQGGWDNVWMISMYMGGGIVSGYLNGGKFAGWPGFRRLNPFQLLLSPAHWLFSKTKAEANIIKSLEKLGLPPGAESLNIHVIERAAESRLAELPSYKVDKRNRIKRTRDQLIEEIKALEERWAILGSEHSEYFAKLGIEKPTFDPVILDAAWKEMVDIHKKGLVSSKVFEEASKAYSRINSTMRAAVNVAEGKPHMLSLLYSTWTKGRRGGIEDSIAWIHQAVRQSSAVSTRMAFLSSLDITVSNRDPRVVEMLVQEFPWAQVERKGFETRIWFDPSQTVALAKRNAPLAEKLGFSKKFEAKILEKFAAIGLVPGADHYTWSERFSPEVIVGAAKGAEQRNQASRRILPPEFMVLHPIKFFLGRGKALTAGSSLNAEIETLRGNWAELERSWVGKTRELEELRRSSPFYQGLFEYMKPAGR